MVARIEAGVRSCSAYLQTFPIPTPNLRARQGRDVGRCGQIYIVIHAERAGESKETPMR